VVRLDGTDQVPLRLEHIVVALDGSSFAERSLPYARWLAKRHSAQIVLVSVLEVPEAAEFGVLADVVQALRDEAESTAAGYLEDISAALEADGVSVQHFVEATGPARAIIDRMDKYPRSMSMLATHGRSGLGGALIGSVAWRVVQHAHGPVFLFPVHEARSRK
jgi:nucleotide-binding universal stress UspA family protein